MSSRRFLASARGLFTLAGFALGEFLSLAPAQAALRQAQGTAVPAPRVVEFPVVTHPAYQWGPAISGNIVVWMDTRNGNADIYGAQLEWRR